jgi:5-methylcytosine-specific restriction endonuclease McrA
MIAQQRRCLVLNSDHRPKSVWPLDVVDARDALKTVLRDGAYVVEAWPDAFFRSPSVAFPVPKTIALRDYVNVHAAPKFCRQSVLLRDRYRCRYCNERHDASDLTYDHVVPRSRGGRTEWSNIVMACATCNARKRDRTCQEAGMHPLGGHPRAPTSAELLRAGLELLPNDVRQTWPEYLYWHTELEA